MTAATQIDNLRQRLVLAQSDLAVLDEKREVLKREIDATRNFLNGTALGHKHAVEQREAAEARAAEAAPAAE